MRTTSKVLAFAGAGSALAGAPPAYSQGGAWGSSDGAAYGSSSSGAAAVSGSASQSWSYSFGSVSGSASGYAGASGWGTGVYPAASSSVPVYPGGYSSPAGAGSFPPARGPSAGGAPHGGPSVVTQYTTLYESESACAAGAGATETVTITETGTVTGVPVGPESGAPGAPSGYPAGPGGEPSRSPGEIYTTIYTTIYETSTAAGVRPYTYAGWSSSYTHYEKSTCTETGTTVVTHPYPSTEPAGAGSASGYPSGGAGGYPSGGAGGYPSGGAGAGSASGYPSGGAGGYPSGGAGGYPSGYPSGSVPVGPGSGSGVPSGYPGGPSGYPSASGSVPVGPGSVSASWSVPAGSGYPGGPTGTGWGSSGLHPTGYPTGTGSHPKPSGCVPCEGQKGSLPFCGLTVNDNWYDVAPKTCKTVEYTFVVTNETVSPDGVPRMGLVVNGQLPGPMIHASWGDTVKVHVINKLPADGKNGTTFHFHGIRQNGTNEMDGVGSLTQCPIAPGESMTYEWVANSYGTSWWHAHYALQTYEGIFGPLQIDGPLQDDVSYDDEQFFLVQDWSHRTADEIYEPSLLASNPNNTRGPTLDTGLINGKNVWQGSGERFQMTVTAGKTYRLRLINTAIQSTFKFYVDQHLLTVFAMDFVPITPYQTNMVSINIGQRYDLLLKADQPVANYWVRGDNQQPCGTLINSDDIKGIIHYDGADSSDPTSQAYGYQPSCLDEPYDNLKPIVPWSAGAVTTELDETVVVQPNSDNMYRWYISGTTGAPNTFLSQWGDPTLVDIYDNGQVPDYSGNLAIEVPNLGEWVYIVIDTPIPAPHPIHLHGHDFLILAQGTGTYSSSVSLNLVEPPRRDVAVLPTDPINGLGGYLVIAYYTSNPGVWLLHCHIGWHNTMGFALQIIENLEGIKKTVKNPSQLHDTCSSWASYAKEFSVVPDNFEDSGV